MKIAVFNLRDDEREIVEKYSKLYNIEIKEIKQAPQEDNVEDVKGCDCISITTNSRITRNMMAAYRDLGIRFISTRTIGYEHIDIEAATEYGIKAGNIAYSPNSVADYAIMMILMVLRKVKNIMYRSLGQDYELTKSRGKELPNLTVGIIGTGKIGATVAKHLTGFGCKLIAYDPYPKKELESILTYVSLDELYREADVITIHVPATDENIHMINKESIAKMKQGVVIINTARGSLLDSNALIEGIESGHVSGAGLDVIDGDRLIYYRDQKYEVIAHREMAILNGFPNVLMMPHTAFYTDEAVDDMVRNSLLSCKNFIEGKSYEGGLN